MNHLEHRLSWLGIRTIDVITKRVLTLIAVCLLHVLPFILLVDYVPRVIESPAVQPLEVILLPGANQDTKLPPLKIKPIRPSIPTVAPPDLSPVTIDAPTAITVGASSTVIATEGGDTRETDVVAVEGSGNTREANVIPAAYLRPPELQYPRLSWQLHEQGEVMLRVLIDESGIPREIVVTHSSGYPRLDDAAVVAMRSAVFRPRYEHGIPRPVYANCPIKWGVLPKSSRTTPPESMSHEALGPDAS